MAVRTRDFRSLRRLCSGTSENLTAALRRRDGQGHTLMHWAAKAGDVEALELLAGEEVSYIGSRGKFQNRSRKYDKMEDKQLLSPRIRVLVILSNIFQVSIFFFFFFRVWGVKTFLVFIRRHGGKTWRALGLRSPPIFVTLPTFFETIACAYNSPILPVVHCKKKNANK